MSIFLLRAMNHFDNSVENLKKNNLDFQLSLQCRNRRNKVVQHFLHDILERALDQITNPALDEVGNEVDDGLQDPIQRSEAVDVDADVADVRDLEDRELERG